MKCNRCGNEFGEGLICQHCGIDRVEGLGSYKGLDPFTIKGGKLGPGSTTAGGISVSNTNSMLCFSCGEIIPGEAEYCPFCQKEQYVKCPNCGFRYLAQYPSCYKCGTNRESYLREKKAKEEEEQKRREAQAKEEAEKHRIQKEKEMRDAENRRLFEAQRIEIERRRKQREQEAKDNLRTHELGWIDKYLWNNRTTIVDTINEDLKKTRRGHLGYRVCFIFFISVCLIGLISVPIFVLVDDVVVESDNFVSFFTSFIIGSILFCLLFAVLYAKSEPPLPKDMIKKLICDKYFESSNGIPIRLVSSGDFDRLLDRNGITLSHDGLSLSSLDSSSHNSEFIQQPHSQELSSSPERFVYVEPTTPYSKAFIYLQNMAIHFEHSDFLQKTLEEKRCMLERYCSDHLISDSNTSVIVEAIISDYSYWLTPNCLKPDSLSRELRKIKESL